MQAERLPRRSAFLVSADTEAEKDSGRVIPQVAVWAKGVLRVYPDNGVIGCEPFASDVADNGTLAFFEALCPTH